MAMLSFGFVPILFNIIQGAPFYDVLSGQDVRLCAVRYLPALWTEKDLINGTVVSRTGLAVHLFDYLTKALNITYSYVELKDEDVLTYGLFQACTNALLDDKLDVVSIPSFLTPAAYKVMDVVATPAGLQQVRFTMPYPEEENRIFALFRPFRLELWFWVLVVVIVTPISFHWLSFGYHRLIDPNCPAQSISDYGIYIATIFLCQGNWIRLRQHSIRLATGLFCLAAVILVNCYASKMTAYLSVPKLQPIIDSLQEMAESTTLEIMMDIKTPLARTFLAAKDGPFKRVGDLIRNGKVQTFNTSKIEEAVQKLKGGRSALLQVDGVSFPIIHAAYKAAGRKCLFTVSKPIGIHLSYHFYTVKNGIYTDPISAKWQTLWDNGIWNLFLSEYLPDVKQCMVDYHEHTTKGKEKPLSSKDLSGAFALLSLGLSLSLLVYVMERCLYSLFIFLNLNQISYSHSC